MLQRKPLHYCGAQRRKHVEFHGKKRKGYIDVPDVVNVRCNICCASDGGGKAGRGEGHLTDVARRVGRRAPCSSEEKEEGTQEEVKL